MYLCLNGHQAGMSMAIMANIKAANAYLPSHDTSIMAISNLQLHVCLVISSFPEQPVFCLFVRPMAKTKATNACLSDHHCQDQSLQHWHQHSLLCIYGLKCCCTACRCMLGMTSAASVMLRGITLKAMQSAAALGGSSNQTAMKKTSPAGSMCQYVPDHQHSHLHNTLLGCEEEKPSTLHQLQMYNAYDATHVRSCLSCLLMTSLRHLNSQTVHVHPSAITQRSNMVSVTQCS